MMEGAPAHINMDDLVAMMEAIKQRIKSTLHKHYHIDNSTIEIEVLRSDCGHSLSRSHSY